MTETLKLRHLIDGQEIAGTATVLHHNPADPADLRIELPEADDALIRTANAAAAEACAEMLKHGIEQRADALAAISRNIVAESEALAILIARETGKVLGDAKGEVMRAARIFDFFAGETLRNVGERFASTRPGVTVEVEHGPVGVIGIITPWNFPIAIPAWKIAPAIAFGNAIVWKPSEISSAVAAALMAIIARSSLPAGAVNLVLGAGATGAALVQSEGLDAISFTGSERTGGAVRRVAMDKGIRVQTEMGGVNGLIVLADADLGNAIECVINGAFYGAGQRCTATSRIIVEEAIADRLAAGIIERMKTLPMGDPRTAGTLIGPLASMKQKELIAAQVRAVEALGLQPAVGGSAVDARHAFFPPTLFLDAPIDSPLTHEEIFGPVAALFRVPDFDAAIDALNANRFGLSAGLCTRSLARAEQFKVRARAGMLMINQPTAGVDYHAPFGGTAASSYGPREQGRMARQFYTNVKTSYQLPL
ncbi:MAG: aldehyde dehydrogenase [Sphingomonas bacterium]|nr:aldehyde dehydrogenase [Sphingomonas bacterium]